MGKTRKGKDISLHQIEGGIMSMAGLWERWKSPEGDVIESCTILTTTANSLIKPLHDRMPVILHWDEIALWLDGSVDEIDRLRGLFHSYPSDSIEEYVVSKDVNRPKNDNPSCLLPV